MLATVLLAQTPTGHVNHKPRCQTLRHRSEQTDGPYIVPWKSADFGSARPLGEVNSWAEHVSQGKQSLHSPDVQIQGVPARVLWLLSAVKIALGRGEEEIPQAAPVPATQLHWSKGVVANPQPQDQCRKQRLETNRACRQCLTQDAALDNVVHAWYSSATFF